MAFTIAAEETVECSIYSRSKHWRTENTWNIFIDFFLPTCDLASNVSDISARNLETEELETAAVPVSWNTALFRQ